jgi:hypothetical protein
MAVATITTEPDGPLTKSHQDEIASAHDRAKKIRKAAGVANFNGWVTGIFAVSSAPFALFSLPGFIVSVGLAIVTYNEFKGRKRLLRFDPGAAELLGWNQVGFLVLIVCYCIWMLVMGLMSAGPFAAELEAKPELREVFDSVEGFDVLYKLIIAAVYGLVIVLSVVFQGLNALYYFTRRKHIESFVRDTPDWVLDLQRLTT